MSDKAKKVIIWISCAFIYAATTTALRMIGISLGAIPTIIMLAIMFAIIKGLTKLFCANEENNPYDMLDYVNKSKTIPGESEAPENQTYVDKKSEKAFQMDNINKNTLSAADTSEPTTEAKSEAYTNIITISETAKSTAVNRSETQSTADDIIGVNDKQKNKTNADSKKKNTATPFIIVIALLSIALIGTGTFSAIAIVNNNREIAQLHDNESKLHATIAEQSSIMDKEDYQSGFDKTRIKTLEDRVDHLQKSYDNLQDKNRFYVKYIVFINDGSNLYHTYDCNDFDSSYHFYAHNVDWAQSQGYKPCQKCRRIYDRIVRGEENQ